ncbi:hypothetical protein ACP70R_013013 [Stipagrostis hirtigluma subsp. patula]
MELPVMPMIRSPLSSDAIQTSDANKRWAMDIDGGGTAAGKRKLAEPGESTDSSVRESITEVRWDYKSPLCLYLCDACRGWHEYLCESVNNEQCCSSVNMATMEIEHSVGKRKLTDPDALLHDAKKKRASLLDWPFDPWNLMVASILDIVLSRSTDPRISESITDVRWDANSPLSTYLCYVCHYWHGFHGQRDSLGCCPGSFNEHRGCAMEIEHADMDAMDQQCSVDIQHGDMSPKQEEELCDMSAEEEEELQLVTPMQLSLRALRLDDRNFGLLSKTLTRDEIAVKILHMVRCREFTEYNPKLRYSAPTRFCQYNIAFFDLDKESNVKHDTSISTINNCMKLDDSINVISIKVAESDVDYPINVYGTVLARDEIDHRCVYLFNRGRDDSQLINSPDDTLTLTGPYRVLAVTDSMFFEVHLKIKCDGKVDKDFSKGLLVHLAGSYISQPTTLSLESCLSTVDIEYTPVPFAVEAYLEALIVKGASNFTVSAWTSGNVENKVVLYDNTVADSQTNLGNDGSVPLTRRAVAVPCDEDLVVNVLVCEGEGSHEVKSLEFIVKHDDDESFLFEGPYELQVKIRWTAVVRKCAPDMFQYFGSIPVLYG